MLTTKLSRRLSWRRKCRFSRNAWRTWKLSTALTKRSSNSILKFLVSAQLWTKSDRTSSRSVRANSETSCVMSKELTPKSWQTSRSLTCSTLLISKKWPKSSKTCKSNLNASKSPITLDWRRSGKWTKKKLLLLLKRSSKLTRSSTLNSSISHGSHQRMTTSKSSSNPQTSSPQNHIRVLSPKPSNLKSTLVILTANPT